MEAEPTLLDSLTEAAPGIVDATTLYDASADAPNGTAQPNGQAPHPEAEPDGDALSRLEATVLGDVHPERRAWYVENLFRGDDGDYGRVLGKLAEAASWPEATQIIGRDVFRRHRINIYSEPAIAFTDAAETRFSG